MTGTAGAVGIDQFGALAVGPRVLAEGASEGPLAGLTTVIKDLFDVAGLPTGGGNPDYLAQAKPANQHSWAVDALVRAGATVIGKAHTDELAFSLSGTNVHYGTPVNPRAPGRIPGGSSSGSAVAVASGLVPFALGTDTGGSIRIPASYTGIFGFRPTHGRIPTLGLVPLAPRFDTVGVLAERGELLELVGTTLLSEAAGRPSITSDSPYRSLVIADDLTALADPAVAAAVGAAVTAVAETLGLAEDHIDFAAGREGDWRGMFMARQLADIWATHGTWVSERQPNFGPGITTRMRDAASAPPERGVLAELGRAEVLAALFSRVPADGVLVFPSASSVAPPIDMATDEKVSLRMRSIAMTCVAGLGGLPAVSIPLAEVDGLPVGVCFVGRPGDDERLLALAAQLDRVIGTR